MKKSLSQSEVKNWFQEELEKGNVNHYSKFGNYDFTRVDEKQEVITITSSGEETRNTAHPGDYIIIGSGGEKYVLKPETFEKRYQILFGTEDHGIAQAIGQCWGFSTDKSGYLEAPWGTEMIFLPGDYIVSPNKEFSEFYRIDLTEFHNSYIKAEDTCI